MKNVVSLLAILIVASSFVCCSNSTEPNEGGAQVQEVQEVRFAKNITLQELDKVLADSPILLDVRTPEEFNAGHIDGAININYYDDDFDSQVAELEKSEAIVIYCKSGGRSSSAMGDMEKVGFQKLYNLEGGYTKYRAQH